MDGEMAAPVNLLPYTETNKRGQKIKVDWLREEHLSEAYSLIQSTGRDAVGIDPSIFTPERRMRDFLLPIIKRRMAVALIYEDLLVGLYFVHPAPVCRSASPIMQSGYGMLAKDFQDTGIGWLGGRIYLILGTLAGYAGVNGRASQRNTIAFTTYTEKRGVPITCWLPQSCNTPALGWTEDILITSDFSSFGLNQQVLGMSEDEVRAHAKKVTKPLHPVLVPRDDRLRPLVTTLETSSRDDITLRSTDELRDVQAAYRLLSEAAEQGDGFGLDEFPSLDYFRQRYLAGRQLLLATTRGATVAIAIWGASHLCRSPGSPSGLFYIYTPPPHRDRGIGRSVLHALEDHAKDCGFTSLHTDLFVTQNTPYRFYRQQHYVCVGSIPNSGYIRGLGWTDCLLFYKSLQVQAQLMSYL